MAMVNKPFPLGATLKGELPDHNQYVMIIVKVFGEERLRNVSTMGVFRTLPSPSHRFMMMFSTMDYYESTGRLRGDSFGRTYLAHPSEVYIDQMEDDVGYIYISMELWLVEPHPTKPDEWVKLKRYAVGTHKVHLACPHCVY